MPKIYKDMPSPTDETKADNYSDIRCDGCNKLIIKLSYDFEGEIEIVCPRCSKKMKVTGY